MRICKSSYTPGLKDAHGVGLQVGDRIKYVGLDGETVTNASVRSDFRQHTNGRYGYECVFEDDGKLWFADEDRIIWWDKKVD